MASAVSVRLISLICTTALSATAPPRYHGAGDATKNASLVKRRHVLLQELQQIEARIELKTSSTSTTYRQTEEHLLLHPTSPHVYFSEKNWHLVGDSIAVAVNPGAYLKLSFTGSSRVGLRLKPTNYEQKGSWPWEVERRYMTIAYSLNDAEMSTYTIEGGTDYVTLKTGLNVGVVHHLIVYIYNSIQLQGADRWNSPPTTGLFVERIVLDLGASTTPPKLRPKRALFFGDSITEGVMAHCVEGGDLVSNAATKSWPPAVAFALDAEYSQVGFGYQGWTVNGAGNVPPFFTPNSDARSSWNKVYSNAPRTFDKLDFVFVLHGTNDGLSSKQAEQVVPAVTGWLQAIRGVAGNQTAIFLVVPFGQFGAAKSPIGALKAAFDAYQSTKGPDPLTFFIDLGSEASAGVASFDTGPTRQACDGIHPRGGTTAEAQLAMYGAKLAVRAALALVTNVFSSL